MSITPLLLSEPGGQWQNPNNLRGPYLNIWGSGMLTFENAYDQFGGDNPYKGGTPQFVEYQSYLNAKSAERHKKYLLLPDAPIVRVPSKRRLSQPALRFDFETISDIRMRLSGGSIFIGTDCYYVSDVYDMEGDYLMVVKGKGGQQYKCWYKKTPEVDLRTPEPQYITARDRTGYLMRPPTKQQRQAMDHGTIQLKRIGVNSVDRGDIQDLLEGLTRDSLRWTETLHDLMTGAKVFKNIRLSKDLAFYRTSTDEVNAEYRGRYLGEVKENEIICDKDDIRPWIRRDVQLVDCTLRGE